MPVEFGDFLNRFPTVELPVTLGEEAHHVFGTENLPLSGEMIDQFIAPLDGGEQDEFTEYVPCFSFVNEEQNIGLVWWKAELLNYQYILAVFTQKGEALDRQIISYTQVKENAIRRAVATIATDFSVIIAEGLAESELYDPENTRTRVLEILPNGRIVSGDQ